MSLLKYLSTFSGFLLLPDALFLFACLLTLAPLLGLLRFLLSLELFFVILLHQQRLTKQLLFLESTLLLEIALEVCAHV